MLEILNTLPFVKNEELRFDSLDFHYLLKLFLQRNAVIFNDEMHKVINKYVYLRIYSNEYSDPIYWYTYLI